MSTAANDLSDRTDVSAEADQVTLDFGLDQDELPSSVATATTADPSQALLGTFERLLQNYAVPLQRLLEVKRSDALSPIVSAHYKKRKIFKEGPSASYLKMAASQSRNHAGQQFGPPLRRHVKVSGRKLTRFLDLGAAPGGWSQWLLGEDEMVTGTGVELPFEQGGRRVFSDTWAEGKRQRYKLVKADLLTLIENAPWSIPELPGSVDVVLAGALVNEVPRDSSDGTQVGQSPQRVLLNLVQLYHALVYLKEDGIFISVASTKSLLINSEIVRLLHLSFKELIPCPNSKSLASKSTYQLIAIGFDENKRADGLRRVKDAIEKLKAAPVDHRAGDIGILLFPETDEKGFFEENKDWLVEFYTPLWNYQADAIIKRQNELEVLEEKKALGKQRSLDQVVDDDLYLE